MVAMTIIMAVTVGIITMVTIVTHTMEVHIKTQLLEGNFSVITVRCHGILCKDVIKSMDILLAIDCTKGRDWLPLFHKNKTVVLGWRTLITLLITRIQSYLYLP